MIKPMLAKNFIDFQHRLIFPMALQPKLNGIRMVVEKGKPYSRSGKPLELPSGLIKDLREYKDLILDGELYVHGIDLEKIYGNAKRLVAKTQDIELEFRGFDICSNQPFQTRNVKLIERLHDTAHIKLVPTHIVKSVKEIEDWLVFYYQQEKYEGVMLRSLDAPYMQTRTSALLKYKPWKFARAGIILCIEGEGKYVGMLGAFQVRALEQSGNWTCNVGTGFDDAQRLHFWHNRKKLLCRTINLKYLELTGLGNPRSPVFINIEE